MRKHRYLDSKGRELAEAEALDAHGLLRDGVRMVVHMTARDAAATDARKLFDSGSIVITDADGTASSGNRPGWRMSDAPINQQALTDARSQYLTDLQNAYRTDACRSRKTKRYDPQGRSQGPWETEEEADYDQASDHRTVTVDALQARRDAAVAPARESMIAETVNAWRRNK